jgi:hypothetical protein
MNTHKNALFLFLSLALYTLAFPVKAPAQDVGTIISHGNLKKDLLDFSDRSRWEKMRKSYEYEQQSKLVNEILFLNDPPKALASLEWLKDIVKEGEETYYVYPSIYAIQLHRVNYVSNNTEAKITAKAMSYYSKLLLLTDAARCDDNGVGTNRFYNLSKTLSNVDKETESLPDNIKRIAMNNALFLEDKYKNRKKQPSICQTGVGFMARALQSEKTEKVESVAKEGNKYGHIPGSIVISIVPDNNIDVFYISDEDWNNKRNEIRTSFSKSLNKEKN